MNFSSDTNTLFLIALIAPFLWSISFYIDKVLLERHLQKSSIIAIVLLTNLPLLVFNVFFGFWLGIENTFNLPFNYLLLSFFVGGGLLLFGLVPFFLAIRKAEVSSVAPLLQLNPIFAFLLGIIFLNEQLSSYQLIGGVIIVVGAVSLSYEHQHAKINFSPLLLMFLTCLMISGNDLVLKIVSSQIGFEKAFLWQTIGASFYMLILLSCPKFRQEIVSVYHSNPRSVGSLALTNAFFNFSAKFVMQFVISLIPMALAALANSSGPVFVFLLGLGLSFFFPHYVKEQVTRKVWLFKGMAILVIMFGSLIVTKVFF